MIIIGIFWFLFAIAAIMPLRWSLTLLFVALPFGSLTVVPGSTTILPYVAIAPLVVAKALLASPNTTTLWDGLLNWRRLGFLTAFILVALIVTYSAPFLFRGAPTMGLNSLRQMPLGFGSGNITQPLYLMMSFLICLACYLLMLTPKGRADLAVAILSGASMAVLSGIIDMATAGTAMLAPLRTASYAIIETAEVVNTRRVIGFDTEASAYGALVLSFAAILIFMSPASWLGKRAVAYQAVLSVCLVGMTVLSTSSSAYLGLAALVILLLLRVLLRLVAPRSGTDQRTSVIAVLGITFALLIGGLYLIAKPAIIARAAAVIDNTVVQKGSSDSANERGTWNSVSLEGLAATGGYGVGVGSTRSSSWIVAVLSSTGILGMLIMLVFLARGFLSRLPFTDAAIRHAAVGTRYAFLVVLAPAAVAGTLVDFGVFNALFFAVMAVSPKILSLSLSSPATPRMRIATRRPPVIVS